ncbi:unnamed protein product [Rhizophagus irregularis]|nr:unnamed protein product [Rhizophagus irregularis]
MIKKFKYKFRKPFDSKTSSQNLWKGYNDEYQVHVTTSHTESEDISELCEKVVYMEDLEKRREVYGICGECNEPGTGKEWCQSYNSSGTITNFLNEVKSHLEIYISNEIIINKSNENKFRNRKYSKSPDYYYSNTPIISENSLSSMASALSCQL